MARDSRDYKREPRSGEFWLVEVRTTSGFTGLREVWKRVETPRVGRPPTPGWERPGDEELCPDDWAIPVRRVRA